MIFYFIIEEPLFANLQKKFHTLIFRFPVLGHENIFYQLVNICYYGLIKSVDKKITPNIINIKEF